MTLRFIQILIFTLSLSQLWAHEEFNGKVRAVVDGNTIEVVSSSDEVYQIMLHGIDCPELGQAYGDLAKSFLEDLLLREEVKVILKGKDRWGNRYGEVILDDNNDPRHQLLKAGLAWTAERDPNREFEELRLKAEEKGTGLWRENNPTPPWIFRRQQTMLEVKSSK